MSPEALVAALLRRWYVLLIALLLTAAGAYHVLRPSGRYQSSAVIVVEPPATGGQPNRLANLQPSLATVSYSIVQQLQSPAGQAELRAAGVSGSYRLTPRNSGTSATPKYLIPSLEVASELPDPSAANTMVRRIVTVFQRHLTLLQDAQRIPASARMSSSVVVTPSAALVVGSRSRGLIGVGLLGAVGGVLAALWTDRLLLRRRSR
ncbi:hypothetical protein, partial [Phaeacidiphilus oryzae]|uniref:hypothetical protein n=1 Tax=Phaeacidiphilus oryzae TaxID=348818 RepID=UPI00056C7DB9